MIGSIPIHALSASKLMGANTLTRYIYLVENNMSYLKIPMGENDAEANTVGEYLMALLQLLLTLWQEAERFSGKRPFGNSGWEYELHYALAEAGVIKATFYEEEDWKELDEYDEKEANAIIQKALDELWEFAKKD